MWQAVKDQTQVLCPIMFNLMCLNVFRPPRELFGNDRTLAVARPVIGSVASACAGPDASWVRLVMA